MMKANSMYTITNGCGQSLFVADENPSGVTVSVNDKGNVSHFNLPRTQIIEALEYLLLKIKAK
jgi:hypothetical protein